MMLVDSHCHLNHPKFKGDVDGAVARARAAGIGTMLTIGTCLHEHDEVLSIARQFPDIYCSVGIHPHDAEKEPDVSTEELLKRAADPKVIGIGETGLDYYYDNSPRELQRASFRRHIDAARESGLPLIVHTRDAEEDTAALLREGMKTGAYTGVIHCFSASRKFAETALDLGLYISISGIVTFKGADDLRATVADIPLDRLLIETDAPFLAPVPMRGQRNEPAYVGHTAAQVAALKGIDMATCARVTAENFFTLFTKAKPLAPDGGGR